MVEVVENLDIPDWSSAERQAVMAAIIAIEGAPPPDYAAMTDAELTAVLDSVVAELQTRPNIPTVVQDWMTVGSHTVVVPHTP